jgi:hypothetical protein
MSVLRLSRQYAFGWSGAVATIASSASFFDSMSGPSLPLVDLAQLEFATTPLVLTPAREVQVSAEMPEILCAKLVENVAIVVA